MRIGASLHALSQWARVHLMVVTELPRADLSLMPDDLRLACDRITYLRLRPSTQGQRRNWLDPDELTWEWSGLRRALGSESKLDFDHLHIYCLRMMPVWQELQALGWTARRLVFDLNDIESRAAWRGVTGGYRQLGFRTSVAQTLEASRLRWAEGRAARAADVMLACSEGDRDDLARRWPRARIEVLPNVVPAQEAAPARCSGRLRLLFVGSLFYQPNVDAVHWILDALVPALRRHSVEYRITIAGRSPPAELSMRVAGESSCELLADVPSLAPVYGASDVVLCPIRSGGGTRIKVLEALSFARPVVSTRIGAEGLGLRDEDEVLYAETADDFVTQLRRLQADSVLFRHVAEQGQARVREEYSLESLERRLRVAHGVQPFA